MGKVAFLDLCNVFEGISKTKSRKEITDLLSTFFVNLIKESPESLVSALFLSTASIYPQYKNTELGVGEQAIMSVVGDVTGQPKAIVLKKFREVGDLGTIAMENRVQQLFVSQSRLSIQEVLAHLRKIAESTGKDSLSVKKCIMRRLVTSVSSLEAKYIVRLFETKLKIGLALQTVLIALGHAFWLATLQDRSLQDSNGVITENITADDCGNYVKEAYAKRPDFESLIELIQSEGIELLSTKCKATPGIPLKPMLARPCKNLTKAFVKVGEDGFLAEYKYDGERVQMHHINGKTFIFSRNLEDLALKYPDLALLSLSNKSFIIDGEAVAYSNGKILPFQVLSTRKRKHTGEPEVSVCVFAFDILYFDSTELLTKRLDERREYLFRNFKEIKDKFHFTQGRVCKTEEDMESEFKTAIASSCEGVMVKSLSSLYKPSHRTNTWIKIKNDYINNIGDSLDLVVMGAYYGKGKRTGAFGGFLLGTYNEDTSKYETCCKLGTGFSDEKLAEFRAKITAHVTNDITEYEYKDNPPDVWISPRFVWEVRAASISVSPVYVAGASGDRGLSLRFPRFVREREDKEPNQATTSRILLQMFNEDLNAESEDDFN